MSYKVAIGPSSFASGDSTPKMILEQAGAEIIPNPYGRRLTEEEIIRHLTNADGLIAGLEPLNRRVLSSASKLRSIARVGVGMTNVDLKAAEELGIKVSNTPDGPTQAVAEMTLAALLVLCRKLISTNSALHAKRWDKTIGLGLVGAKVLIVGYGRIGRLVRELLKAFGADVVICDPHLDKSLLVDGERFVSLDVGLREAEVVSLHASGEKVLLGPKEFAKMRDGVILLNSARGELVEERSLIEALKSGKLQGAWFDVFWKEPYDGPLTEFDQVILTPHIGTYTQQCRLSMETAAVNNLLRDLEITS